MSLDKTKLQGRTHQGLTAGSFLVDGPAKKGEVTEELKQVVRAGARHAEESLEKERIPADLKAIPLRYYEQILDEE